MAVGTYYSISTMGRSRLGQWVTDWKTSTGANTSVSDVPVGLDILEDLAEIDHGLSLEEVKTRYGSRGYQSFKELQKAGYIVAN